MRTRSHREPRNSQRQLPPMDTVLRPAKQHSIEHEDSLMPTISREGAMRALVAVAGITLVSQAASADACNDALNAVFDAQRITSQINTEVHEKMSPDLHGKKQLSCEELTADRERWLAAVRKVDEARRQQSISCNDPSDVRKTPDTFVGELEYNKRCAH